MPPKFPITATPANTNADAPRLLVAPLAPVKRRQWSGVVRARLLDLYGMQCFYCGLDLSRAGAHLDHVVPLAHGGEDIEANLVPACMFCNALKFTQDAESFAGQRVDYIDGRWRLGAETALLTRAEEAAIGDAVVYLRWLALRDSVEAA